MVLAVAAAFAAFGHDAQRPVLIRALGRPPSAPGPGVVPSVKRGLLRALVQSAMPPETMGRAAALVKAEGPPALLAAPFVAGGGLTIGVAAGALVMRGQGPGSTRGLT